MVHPEIRTIHPDALSLHRQIDRLQQHVRRRPRLRSRRRIPMSKRQKPNFLHSSIRCRRSKLIRPPARTPRQHSRFAFAVDLRVAPHQPRHPARSEGPLPPLLLTLPPLFARHGFRRVLTPRHQTGLQALKLPILPPALYSPSKPTHARQPLQHPSPLLLRLGAPRQPVDLQPQPTHPQDSETQRRKISFPQIWQP